MTAHNDKAKEIRARVDSLHSALVDRAKALRALQSEFPVGSPNHRQMGAMASETEDLIQELDRATDGVPYGEQE